MKEHTTLNDATGLRFTAATLKLTRGHHINYDLTTEGFCFFSVNKSFLWGGFNVLR